MSLEVLKNKRKALKGTLTRFETFVDSLNNVSDKNEELDLRIQKVEGILEEFSDVQNQISLIEGNEDSDEQGLFEDRYYLIITRAKRRLQANTPTHSVTSDANMQLQVKLPQIALPEFNGAYECWCQFRDTFMSLIHNNNSLSNIQRFYYLQSSLKGEAAKVIHSLELTEANYLVAWDLLKSRYENKKFIVKSHINGLFDLQHVMKDSHSSLRQFLDNFLKHYRALKSLHEPVDNWGTLLLHLLISKLDVTTKREWEIKSNGITSLSVSDFINFITDRCHLLESIENSSSKYNNTNKKITARYTHLSFQKNSCIICGGNHVIFNCKDFLSLGCDERFNKIKSLKGCINCLKLSHTSYNCKNESTCRKCNKKHHTLLHFKSNSQNSTEGQSSSSKDIPSNNHIVLNKDEAMTVETKIATHSIDKQMVLLSTAIIYINDKDNNPVACRALLDSGSQSSFLTSDLCSRLGLPLNKSSISIVGINSSGSKVSFSTKTTIKSSSMSFIRQIRFLIVDKITEPHPQFSFEKEKLNIPDHLILADPEFNVSGQINVLLGADIYFEVLLSGKFSLGHNNPWLQKSHFGWLLSGPLQNTNITTHISCNSSTNINEQLENFWKIEENYRGKQLYSKEEIECEDYFQKSFTRDSNGRFVVRLPFRNNYVHLENNLEQAINRFQILERKFARNPKLKVEYTNFLNEYISLGHMSLINNPEIDRSCHYLPHHSVYKVSSLTTKLRVVFDASSKSSSGLSLNDVLKVGPSIQDDIFSILTYFRVPNIVFCADITKMYRQIKVHPEHRDMQRIVWRSDVSQPLNHYVLNTVTYGTAPASFLATRCLKQLALDNQEEYPRAYHAIIHEFYMDDWLSGAETPELAIQLIKEVDNILKGAGFELRQWRSNHPDIFSKNLNLNQDQYYIQNQQENTRTLGINWNPTTDSFQYTTKIKNYNKWTKRTLLSVISGLFDPLGLLGPIITTAKLILQQLWKLKLDWDDDIPSHLLERWNKFCVLFTTDNIKIPRHMVLSNSNYIELHCFSDASQAAYGACIYLRAIDTTGYTSVKLVCAKSRVAPVKLITLPRLELCGALLAAQLCEKTKPALRLSINNTYYWSDSTIVLSWIVSDPSRFKTFVANRIAQIQSLSNYKNWNHVPTHQNPADLISRGVDANSLKSSDLWWSGPEFLNLPQEHWPCGHKVELNLPDVMIKSTSNIVSLTKCDILTRFSVFYKLVRVISYILRFKSNSLKKQNRNFSNLSSYELQYAKVVILRLVQQEVFATEISLLKQNKSVPTNSKLITLNPFLDNVGLIRVGGRLKNSNLEYSSKFPVVLPSNHHVTTLIIRNEHHKYLHAGVQLLLSNIRSNYWILNGKQSIKRVLSQCVTCFRSSPKACTYQMGDLPSSRVIPSRPFSNCGVDYAGPYLIKDSKLRNRKFIKAYICVFVCFSSKAIHLELVSDLTAEGFLNAFKRFTARRGLCSNIYSDNATNFVGANKELQEIVKLAHEYKFKEYLAINNVVWHFIPPRSPHFGGIWESAVKQVKTHLKRVMFETRLHYEQFCTVLCQIESILNSRPILPLSNDLDDLNPLTPGHFLIGGPLVALPEFSTSYTKVSSKCYAKLRSYVESFWSRWSKEYLHTLQQRYKWPNHGVLPDLKGALVILKEDNYPPQHWRMGRIIETHPGKDKIVRVVSIKTMSGTVKRALNRVCILPIERC